MSESMQRLFRNKASVMGTYHYQRLRLCRDLRSLHCTA